MVRNLVRYIPKVYYLQTSVILCEKLVGPGFL